ncbi:MAG: hypothetical protein AAFW46_00950 [Pseudomonadota bacterium]
MSELDRRDYLLKLRSRVLETILRLEAMEDPQDRPASEVRADMLARFREALADVERKIMSKTPLQDGDLFVYESVHALEERAARDWDKESD